MGIYDKMKRQDLVLELVRQTTQRMLELGVDKLSGISAGDVAQKLKLDRANISKELNLLYRSNQLIKLQGKPTRFLHRALLVQAFPYCFLPTTVPSGSDISTYITEANAASASEQQEISHLENLIGAKGSLKTAVEQAKAALSYPPRGLHTLITGAFGIGKRYFAHLMYEYAISNGLMDADAPFITFNCADYSFSPQLVIGQLMGIGKTNHPNAEKSRRGIIEQASGGILYLDDVHRLHPKVQDLLVTLIEKNTFSRVGEASVTRYGNLLIIASSTEAPGSPGIERFQQIMPMHIHLPELSKRGPAEILNHLFYLLNNEASSIGIPIHIDKDILACLVNYPYAGQIGEMKSRIKRICSLAYLECSTKSGPTGEIKISYRHLPPEIAQYHPDALNQSPDAIQLFQDFTLDTILFSPGNITPIPILSASDKVLEIEGFWANIAEKDMLRPQVIEDYIHYCINQFQKINGEVFHSLSKDIPHSLYECVHNTLLTMRDFRPVVQNNGLFYGLLLHINSTIKTKRRENSPDMASLDDISTSYYSEYVTAVELREAISKELRVIIPDSELEFITVYLSCVRKWVSTSQVRMLAVFHGEGIAEGIAAYVNEVCNTNIMKGVSFNSKINLEQLLKNISETAKSMDLGAGILIFSDMEPLNTLHHHITSTTGIKAETIPGASLSLIITLAQRASREGLSLQALASEALSPSKISRDLKSVEIGTKLINRIINEILSTSLTFLNPYKAAEVLLVVLDGILYALSIEYSDDIAIKFIFHCSHMLERVIRNEALKYDKLKQFINENGDLMRIIEKQLTYAAEVFGITIPPSELAYVAEIFINTFHGIQE
jgi:transcriptional regulator with AAA-type ATPase domain/transcriptional regulatory protein LevR